MSEESKFNVNSWLEDELYQQYQHDRGTVDPSWQQIFEGNGQPAPAARGGNGAAYKVLAAPAPAPALAPAPVVHPLPGDQLTPLRGPAARIAENMTSSLTIPTATSQRLLPVKLLEENRRRINDWRARNGQGKVSFTHLVAWAIVRALDAMPVLNNAYAESEGEAFRLVRNHVNLGVAVDVAGKDGTRSLKVPNIKAAESMDFAQFLAAYDDLVQRARSNKLQVPDFEGTTISLTNPGTVGTAGSIPRLMPGQGAIIATGAIDYPPEFRGVADNKLVEMGIGKVMMITCTYDHRVIQGAESGMFLGRLQELLEGEHAFYDSIFSDLAIGLRPASWGAESAALPQANTDPAKAAAVERLIQEYRTRGHLGAHLDPLNAAPAPPASLDPGAHGLSVWDLDRTFVVDGAAVTLRDLIARLERTYCSTIGVQYMHIEDALEREWLRSRMEPAENRWTLDLATRKRILNKLVDAEGFEVFLHTRFMGHKRFSAEGGEAVLAMLDEILERAANAGVQESVMGMAHRGRLTVLANVVGKSMEQLFGEFDGDIDPDSIGGSGDVKYHLGAQGRFRSTKGKEVGVSVAFNPSHLEAVNPVVEGLVRPRQTRLGGNGRDLVIPILIHGDAAFAGQGVVMETLNLSQIPGYETGGTLHIIINNQLGFTANPDEARSTTYSSDAALAIQAPVFHVNGDDPEACIRVAQLAFDYRQTYKKDVVIDMVCYRKHGHNETDDPSYTQPRMYAKIAAHKPVAALYADRLLAAQVVTSQEVEDMRRSIRQRLNEVYDRAQQLKQQYEIQELSAVSDSQIESSSSPSTAVDRGTLQRVLEGITTFPADFHLHPKLKPFIEKRREALQPGAALDWATGEALAFGTLALEGTPVRLSGQDSGRGTFSHRHANYVDVDTGREYRPLSNLAPNQGAFEVYDSALSEYAVMGFEFGYSVADPLSLVLWEGQFGDFANGAQIIIDQFLAAAESKWGQPSGMVLLLPHGYEGQGPEHSSARIERFLQLCAEGNMLVANCTTPAQYFHLLRRQMRGGADNRGMRKPLILFTPKSILRHPKAVSTLDDLAAGRFEEILDDPFLSDRSQVNRILLCSGKIFYDLLGGREQKKADNVAIVRVEQLYPFRESMLAEILDRYPAAAEVLWVQEEPKNMGAWTAVKGPIRRVLDRNKRRLSFVGRFSAASPAAGSLKRHQREQAQIVEDCFTFPLAKRQRTRLVRRKKA